MNPVYDSERMIFILRLIFINNYSRSAKAYCLGLIKNICITRFKTVIYPTTFIIMSLIAKRDDT